jgi:hypothetical protein
MHDPEYDDRFTDPKEVPLELRLDVDRFRILVDSSFERFME